MPSTRIVVAFVLAVAFLAVAAGALEVPFLSGRVVDQAGLIDAATLGRVEARLAALEQATGAQVAVLTVPTLDGDPIEDFGIRVVEAWQLGRKDIDDGALFLVAPAERRMRIEVGYGLEPTLTDATARRILDEHVAPRFRAGDMSGGILAGVEAIALVVEGSELPAVTPARGVQADWTRYLPVGLLLLVLLIVITSRYRSSAVWTSDHGWSGRDGRGRDGGWWWWGGGGGGGFSGGGGFGGFSGGGGSFGGGGASSSW